MTRSCTDMLRRLSPLAAALVLAAGATASFAEPADAPLSGPSVQDRDVPGAPARFGEGGQERRRDGANPRLFMRAVQSLNAEDTPDALRADDEQIEQVRVIMDEFRDAQKSFMTGHADELKALREKAGLPGRGQRGGPDGENGAARQRNAEATPEQQAARQQLKDIMSKGPKFEDYQTKVWDILSAPQREHVRVTMESIRADMAKGEGPRRERRGGPDDMMGPPPPQGEQPGDAPKVSAEQLQERLDKLPPRQRARVLRELNRMLDRAERGDAERPMPDMDNVDVPPPDRVD